MDITYENSRLGVPGGPVVETSQLQIQLVEVKIPLTLWPKNLRHKTETILANPTRLLKNDPHF